MSDASTTHDAVPPSRAPFRVRVVTAASLFDGHDAAINIMRRILQAHGAEVIHLGHDRSVDEIVTAAIHEDAHAIAVSSYQGGHNEFFRYMVDMLRDRGAPNVRVYGGGGGTILPDEVAALHAYGVARIFSPEDGRAMGLEGMIATIIQDCATSSTEPPAFVSDRLSATEPRNVARAITWLENADDHSVDPARVAQVRHDLERQRGSHRAPVVGFTGTGGAGKSSVVDEVVRRFRFDSPDATIALLLVDPTRRRSGGALLGDRIRMNAIHGRGVYVRSLATRQANLALSHAVNDALSVLQAAHFDLILLETAGIGQSDSEIVDLVDVSVYVMTPEYGAPSQLEKIDMLDLANVVVLNKFDRQGGADALRDVRKQWMRNSKNFNAAPSQIPVHATIASQWNDPGTDRLYEALRAQVVNHGGQRFARDAREVVGESKTHALIPGARVRYLAEIAECVRNYHARTDAMAKRAADADGIARTLRVLGDKVPALAETYDDAGLQGEPADALLSTLRKRYHAALAELDPSLRQALQQWPATRARYQAEVQSYEVRGRSIDVVNRVETLSHSKLSKVAVPTLRDWGELTRYVRREYLPGHFPFTAGVFAFKREGEDPVRMFAGEGGPERTNQRFHFLARGESAVRLSTAFDSVTLYGRDPHERPDIYGKVGTSGVSLCSVDDAKRLYSGFDLCDAKTSVSMTINGPAPTVLAFYLNAAIDQQVEKHLRQTGQLNAVRALHGEESLPRYVGTLPEGHTGLGLGLLGIAGDRAVDAETYARIKAETLCTVRGTVQADILKEDQAQNTCIFSTVFSLKVMGDIQSFFVEQDVRNFYSVSISGYHIAEAGANPITQLAFTLANGFTYVESYLARGMKVDDFAPNFSFFFSNGLDAEYNVIGRVARRIWAVAMRDRYGASERSQKLKYHVQTSGRSLHAQEMAFNDIRTTLQALTALQDHCNSLHTNAYDEAVTTPTEESVRRALAIQLIINRELGLGRVENALSGSYIVEELTDLVEAAVLAELERISERGGVLGAMETLYQRSKIQEESLHYESLKHSGALPIIGVNTFENPDTDQASARPAHLMRASDEEKSRRLDNLRAFQSRHAATAGPALLRLQQVARDGGNVFSELLETVKHASLGQITDALFDVGGRYRRSM